MNFSGTTNYPVLNLDYICKAYMLLSIITCVKNDTSDLITTYESIAPFLCSEMGWLIKFSQHCSPAFVDSVPHNNYIKKTYIEDSSLYHGLNQALNICESQYYLVLGAGDTLIREGFWNALSEIDNVGEKDAYFFACYLANIKAIITPSVQHFNLRMSCPHPSCILSVQNSKTIGYFNTQYEIAADYDHLCRYTSYFDKFNESSTIITIFKGGGLSEIRGLEGILEEELVRMRVYQSNELAVRSRLLSKCAKDITTILNKNFS